MTARRDARVVRLHEVDGRERQRLRQAREPQAAGVSHAVGFPEACRRLGFSERTGKTLLAEGRFPIPSLPRLGPRGWHRFSSIDIDLYLSEAAVQDVVRVRRRG